MAEIKPAKRLVFLTWLLQLWWFGGELDKRLVAEPICLECIGDLREVLVERADDVKGASEPSRSKKAG